MKIKAEKVMTKLKTNPEDTKQFVQYIDYLENKCPEILKQIEKTLEYALIVSYLFGGIFDCYSMNSIHYWRVIWWIDQSSLDSSIHQITLQ